MDEVVRLLRRQIEDNFNRNQKEVSLCVNGHEHTHHMQTLVDHEFVQPNTSGTILASTSSAIA